ncbi:MAG TPA: T9SS type A sorting domain-containing protein, partial [Bacteroidia bacterium]|nr:T9SS type A sorting domain-containing protein [Bacteroidia bacterium]
VTYQEVPMAADSTYEIGMLANADAYTADTLDGTGHLRVTVAPSCVTVDFVRAYLPADTVSGVHQNREVAFSYTIGNCTSGLSQINSDEVIKIFPNPANSVLSVKLPEGVFKYKVELVNTLGESLLHSASNVMDISGIPDGIYLVRVHTDTSEFNRKMIICH